MIQLGRPIDPVIREASDFQNSPPSWFLGPEFRPYPERIAESELQAWLTCWPRGVYNEPQISTIGPKTVQK